MDPTDDFFTHVNGDHFAENPIPDNQMAWGSFVSLRHEMNEQLQVLVKTTKDKFLAGLWGQLNDISSSENWVRDLIKKAQTSPNVFAQSALLGRHGIKGALEIEMQPDAKEPTMNRLHVTSSGMGLPSREYYFGDLAEKLPGYKKYLQDLHTHYGIPWSDKVMDYEMKLAEHSHNTADHHNPSMTHHEMIGLAELGNTKKIITDNAVYWKFVKENPPPPEWTTAAILRDTAQWGSPATFDLWFAFQGSLTGQPKPKPRSVYAMDYINEQLGEYIGRLYVGTFEDPEKLKKDIAEIVKYIRSAFSKTLASAKWLTEETRAKAQTKLDNMRVMSAFPDHWRAYPEMETGKCLLETMAVVASANIDHAIALADTEVNRGSWCGHCPQAVNAYYWWNQNAIVIPLGVLVKPFFRGGMCVEDFGGLGCIVGHEITHGFDSSGSKFNALGALDAWWSDEDSTAFQGKVDQMIALFDGITVNGTKCNGKNTAGENIADFGGLKVGFAAYEEYLASRGQEFTKDLQRKFFTQWARVFAIQIREQMRVRYISTNVHSLPELRVNMSLAHFDAWYSAFSVKPSARMYVAPKDRVSVW